MTAVLPTGYVTLLEAAETLLPAMYAGVPDLPIVTSLQAHAGPPSPVIGERCQRAQTILRHLGLSQGPLQRRQADREARAAGEHEQVGI
jgi:hypothetical protein